MFKTQEKIGIVEKYLNILKTIHANPKHKTEKKYIETILS